MAITLSNIVLVGGVTLIAIQTLDNAVMTYSLGTAGTGGAGATSGNTGGNTSATLFGFTITGNGGGGGSAAGDARRSAGGSAGGLIYIKAILNPF
jgi:hypothetical protein